jgi:hypothetical protein
MGVGDKGVGGSRPWFEGLGGPLSEAMHCGAGDPWCLLGSSPRSLRSRADHGRVRWLVEGGDPSFQDVGTELSFLDLGAGELEDFSEWVSWDAETELRVLKSNTQRVPPLDVGTSVSEQYPWHRFNFFSRCFTPLGH